MRTLPIDRPHLDDPLYSQKNPHQTFLLALSVASSWPLLQGRASSAVLETQLSDQTVILWGVSLFLGSAAALLGEFWTTVYRRGHDWTGLVIERSGLLVVGAAALIYSYVIWRTAAGQADVSFVAGVTAAYGASCLWRVGQITRRLRWLRRIRAQYDAAYAEQYAADQTAAIQEDERRG